MPDAPDASEPLHTLYRLLLATPEVESLLGEIAVLAAAIVEPAVSCGITVHYGDEPLTVASSDARAPIIDEEQYHVREGPCLEALRTGRLVDVPDQGTDERWAAYAQRARERGVQSSVSLPLLVDGRSLGALNLYSDRSPHAFADEAVRRRALEFADRAAVVLTLAIQRLEQDRTARELEEALASRTLIDQAIGVIMAQQGCDAHVAFDLLRHQSQTRNRKLRQVAEDLITRVSGSPPVAPPTFETDPPD
jgi:GAF domain-containing protein